MERERTRRVWFHILPIIVIGASLLAAFVTWTPFEPAPRQARARLGVCVSIQYGVIESFDVGGLPFGWYCDYRFQIRPPRPNGVDYVQTIWGYPPDWKALALAVLVNRGSLWLVGSEPENRYQGAYTPSDYARAYHDVYYFIKRLDASALVAVGGISQPTPLRLQWLDRVLASYEMAYGEQMPVDVWNIHCNIAQEKRGSWGSDIPVGLDATEGQLYTLEESDDLQIFVEHIVAFRQWMRDRGQQNKPLIISEFGILQPAEYGFPPERVNEFMRRTFEFMLTAKDKELGYPPDDYRLVQRWAWFSLNYQAWDPATGEGFNGQLLDWKTGALTPMGREFARLAVAAATD